MTSLPIELQADEQVIMRVHRHIIFLFVKLLGVALFGVIPVIILLVLASTLGPELVIMAALWGIITLLIGYFLWFHHHLVSADLINIENMTVSKSGFLPTLFNYGDLCCETAGHEANFILRDIHDPAKVLDTVDSARDEVRQRLGKLMAVQY